ncbi:hypothetical protein AAMO2058_001450100 [Amorphochlora amoebiformis]
MATTQLVGLVMASVVGSVGARSGMRAIVSSRRTPLRFSGLCKPIRHKFRGFSSQGNTRLNEDLQNFKKLKDNAKIRMLHDGECPLCEREVNMLRKRSDERGGSIEFVDISSKNYNPNDNRDIDFETAMQRIHGILPDGTVVRDVEVFRLAYEAVGLGWVYAFTKVEPLRKAMDVIYGLWAKNRLLVTQRPDLETILSEKKFCSDISKKTPN